MTLEQFTISRRDELVAFFQARFGKPWRKMVAIQSGLHPRWYDRWKGVSPLSLYRQIYKLETWARTIGFESATDSEVRRRLKIHQEFKDAAAREIEETKRIQAELAEQELQARQFRVEFEEALRRHFQPVVPAKVAEESGSEQPHGLL